MPTLITIVGRWTGKGKYKSEKLDVISYMLFETVKTRQPNNPQPSTFLPGALHSQHGEFVETYLQVVLW